MEEEFQEMMDDRVSLVARLWSTCNECAVDMGNCIQFASYSHECLIEWARDLSLIKGPLSVVTMMIICMVYYLIHQFGKFEA